MDSQEIERLARKRAGAKMGFIVHATVYVLVNLMLMAMALSMGRNWAIFPAISWGFGLAIHGVVVFFLTGNSGLHDRLVERERLKLQRDPW
ncbi:2TM domain-containing protein [Ramlibacter albus]|nr:2TM domain-containing protein [Ramlibacter albus]